MGIGSFTLVGGLLATNAGRFSPGDGNTYYFGGLTNTAPASSATPINRTYFAQAGTVRAVYLLVINTGTLGSSETSSLVMRINDTTDYSTITGIRTDAASGAFFRSGLSIGVDAGDFFEWKWTAPTYAPNPTNVQFLTWIHMD